MAPPFLADDAHLLARGGAIVLETTPARPYIPPRNERGRVPGSKTRMSDEKMGRPAPVVLATVICDAIYQDPGTRKCTLLGTFSTIRARQFPVRHPQLSVHVALTDGHGRTRIRLMIVPAEGGGQTLFSGEGVIEFTDPRMVAELNFAIANLTFPAPGEYRLQVYGNDELLMERRLDVLQIGPPPPPAGPVS